jgi:hypothetical protein
MMPDVTSKYLQQSSCESVTRRIQARKHQVCDHCGGRFGLVTRWWGNRFCKKLCKRSLDWARPKMPSVAGSDFRVRRAGHTPAMLYRPPGTMVSDSAPGTEQERSKQQQAR